MKILVLSIVSGEIPVGLQGGVCGPQCFGCVEPRISYGHFSGIQGLDICALYPDVFVAGPYSHDSFRRIHGCSEIQNHQPSISLILVITIATSLIVAHV